MAGSKLYVLVSQDVLRLILRHWVLLSSDVAYRQNVLLLISGPFTEFWRRERMAILFRDDIGCYSRKSLCYHHSHPDHPETGCPKDLYTTSGKTKRVRNFGPCRFCIARNLVLLCGNTNSNQAKIKKPSHVQGYNSLLT